MDSVFFPEEDIKLIKQGQTVFSGALLMADISGFTEITETLSRGGREGVEELTSLLNRCFNSMLKTVFNRKGSVITFSGDSILVRFDDHENASVCAKEILQAMDEFRRVVILGKRFSIIAKAVVAKGSWNQYIIGNSERAHILVSGGLVRELGERENNASPGDLISFKSLSEPSNEPYEPPETHPGSFLSPGSERLYGEHRPVTPVFITVLPTEHTKQTLVNFQQLYVIIQKTVQAHGGYLHHIDDLSAEGTRIMALFGAPVSEGRDVLNGVLSAITIQSGIETTPNFKLSCGIDTGYAFSGMIGNSMRKQYTVIGDPVNTAARLAGVAAPGTIIVSAGVVAKTAGAVQYGEPVSVSLKGKEGRIESYPALGRSQENFIEPFVGRHREIAEIRNMITGEARFVLLSGSAGVGKTTLLRGLEKELAKNGFRVIRGSAGMRGAGTGILSSLLENICGTGGDLSENLDVLIDSVGDPQLSRRKIFLANMLLRLNIPHRDFDRLPPKLRSENLLDAMILLLSSLEEKTCVFLEDIHQAEKEELAFLFKVIQGAIERSDTAFLISARPEGEKIIPSSPVPAKFILEGMNFDDSSELLFEYADRIPLNEEISSLLLDRAQGNPFFLVQFLLYMREKGLITVTDGQWVKTGEKSLLELPESVFSMIMARIDTLGERTRESLKVASVVGMRFSEKVLSSVVGRNVHSEMSESIKAGLTFINSYIELEHIFSHMLIRDVAYDSILTERKKQLHRDIGVILEASTASGSIEPGFLAGHFLKGELWEKAADYSMKAGQIAADEFRNLEALGYFSSAAEVLEKHVPHSKNEQAKCFQHSGNINDRIGNFDGAKEFYRRAVACSRDERITQQSLMGIADILFNQGNMDEGLELTEEVERIIEQSSDEHPDTMIQIAAYRAWTHCIKGDMENGEREALRAVELGEALTGFSEYEKARKLGHALNTLATVHWAKSEFSKARELYEKAIELALDNGLKREAAVTWGNIGLTLERQGRYAEAVEGINKQLRMSTEIGEKFLILSAHGDLGMTYSMIGDFEKAMYHATRQMELAESINVVHDLLLAVNHLATINITLGNCGKAEEYVQRAFSILERSEIERERSHTLFNAAKISFEKDLNTQAIEYLDKALELAKNVQSHSLQHLILLDKAEILSIEGMLDEAGSAIDESFSIADQTGMESAIAASRFAKAKLLNIQGHKSEAEKMFRDSIEVFQRLGTRFPLAGALYSLAALLGEHSKEGMQLRDRALELFSQMNVPVK